MKLIYIIAMFSSVGLGMMLGGIVFLITSKGDAL